MSAKYLKIPEFSDDMSYLEGPWLINICNISRVALHAIKRLRRLVLNLCHSMHQALDGENELQIAVKDGSLCCSQRLNLLLRVPGAFEDHSVSCGNSENRQYDRDNSLIKGKL